MKNLLTTTALLALVVSVTAGIARADNASIGAVVAPTATAVTGAVDSGIKDGQATTKQVVSDKKTEVKTTVSTEQGKLDKKAEKTSARTTEAVKTPVTATTVKATDTVKSSLTDTATKAVQ